MMAQSYEKKEKKKKIKLYKNLWLRRFLLKFAKHKKLSIA
jgi:hypothetical protein